MESAIIFVLIVSVFVLLFLTLNLYIRVKALESAPLDNRARNKQGRYVADNPKTKRVNEAYKRTAPTVRKK